MARSIVVLGSTGSIGTQTLEVAKWHRSDIKIVGLAAGRNIDVLEKQVRTWRPQIVGIAHPGAAGLFRDRVRDLDVEIVSGEDAASTVASCTTADLAVCAIVGIDGLMPTIRAIESGKTIALATKEALVAAGQIVMDKASRYGMEILPVDSEHSAIFQCLRGHDITSVRRLILTASGGPFVDLSKEEMEAVTVEEALRHPTWSMGAKVTIDSATLMNKALELIEARWLFGMDSHKIHAVIHRQSIVHSMVEFIDGSILAQLGSQDMRLAIQYALCFPNRARGFCDKIDLTEVGTLTFEEPDLQRFSALRLGYEALRAGGTLPCVLNSANEEAVGLFMSGQIGFCDIARLVEEAMLSHETLDGSSLDQVLTADLWAREYVRKQAGRIGR
ncbi:MAG: 1-deoxy-D-xylulose-5-phosphate reductoisomerase [Firmicutes bacterium]|nr:1-deoxy-D-xylulose-5-phosphate reductoisomerase [Bacillota bacterium]